MRGIRRFLLLVLVLNLGGSGLGYRPIEAQTTEIGRDAARVDRPVTFPLAVAPGGRYLEDAVGTPFLIHGESAWGLITQLTREDADRYLDDRHARGFNTILVMLLNASFSTNSPANAYGQMPFLIPGDYSTPNEAYFAHADWVLRRAAEQGFLVLLAPSYTGSGGGSEGWYRAMVANGPDQLRQYGEYLGRRYRDFANILWVQAGDYNPPHKELVRAIAEGIRAVDPRALHTAHGSRETPALGYWEGESWLQVNNIYTALPESWPSSPVYAAALAQYAQPEPLPFFLIEGVYENEHDATERHLRSQAYQAVLSGAAGQIFGSNPIWHFDGRGLYPAPVTWQEALGSRGTQSMTHLRELLGGIPWWRLEPVTDGTLLTGGLGSEDDRAVAARAVDRSFALFYLPSSRTITVDLSQIAGPRVTAHWFDPANGEFAAVSGSPFAATGSHQFRPEPDNNSSGFDDWVLVLKSNG
jgi:hypothetical protein